MSYDDLMRQGRAARGNAGKAVLHYLWPQLAPRREPGSSEPAETLPDVRWSVRGEVRTRETFGRPHRDDFSGGLPLPPEYPERSNG